MIIDIINKPVSVQKMYWSQKTLCNVKLGIRHTEKKRKKQKTNKQKPKTPTKPTKISVI